MDPTTKPVPRPPGLLENDDGSVTIDRGWDDYVEALYADVGPDPAPDPTV